MVYVGCAVHCSHSCNTHNTHCCIPLLDIQMHTCHWVHTQLTESGLRNGQHLQHVETTSRYCLPVCCEHQDSSPAPINTTCTDSRCHNPLAHQHSRLPTTATCAQTAGAEGKLHTGGSCACACRSQASSTAGAKLATQQAPS
jgi:hypothetical protein